MKKYLFSIYTLFLVALLTSCASPEPTVTDSTVESTAPESFSTNSSVSPTNESTSEETISSAPTQLSTDEFISEVSLAISDAISSEDESIDSVSLENGDLHICVTLGDPSPFSYEDLMISRTSSITDKILNFKSCFDLWETITVDFGEHGYIQNGHDNIQDDGYGSYFIQENFVIQ